MKSKQEFNKLVIKAIEIRGTCPVYKVGDKTVINGPFIDTEESDAVCIHALFSLGSFIVALREGLDPAKLGLAKTPNGPGYFQCLDPGDPHTGGGTVLFEITHVKQIP
ncbi:MAG: TIGR04076 family protein [Promethearchaeota archaeon]